MTPLSDVKYRMWKIISETLNFLKLQNRAVVRVIPACDHTTFPPMSNSELLNHINHIPMNTYTRTAYTYYQMQQIPTIYTYISLYL